MAFFAIRLVVATATFVLSKSNPTDSSHATQRLLALRRPVSMEAANTKYINWQGQVMRGTNPVEPGSVSFYWEGVQAMFVITGARSVKMSAKKTFQFDGPTFKVFVNGKLKSKVAILGQALCNYTLADGLDPKKTYSITVWSASDPLSMTWNTITADFITIKAFSLDSGSFGVAPPKRSRNLYIIGDSIAAGNEMSPSNGCWSDHPATYAAKLCEYFRANCTTTALTGKGMYHNCCDDGVTMSEIHKYAMPANPLTEFVSSGFKPDAIILNLGTNDFIHYSKFEQTGAFVEAFKTAYADFLFKLTVGVGRPNLPIFCAFGPISGGAYGEWIEDAMDRARNRGAKSLHSLNFSTAQKDGCYDHPGYHGHQEMFSIAVNIFDQVLGWTPDLTADHYVNLDEYNKLSIADASNIAKPDSSIIAIFAMVLFVFGLFMVRKFQIHPKRWSRGSRSSRVISESGEELTNSSDSIDFNLIPVVDESLSIGE